MVSAGQDLLQPRTLIIVALIVMIGVSGISISLGGELRLSGIGLAGVLGVVLNQALPGRGTN